MSHGPSTFELGSSRALLDVHVPATARLTGAVVIVVLGGSYAGFVDFPYAPLLEWLIPRGVTVALLKVTARLHLSHVS